MGFSLILGQARPDISPYRYVRPVSSLGPHPRCLRLSGEGAGPRPYAGKPVPWTTPTEVLGDQDGIFMMDDDEEDGVRQRVGLEPGLGGVGLVLQAQDRLQPVAFGCMFAAQGGKVRPMHVDTDPDQARADALCAREVEWWQRQRGPVVQVRAPEVPQMVVHGFDLHEDASATGGFGHAGGSLGRSSGGWRGRGGPGSSGRCTRQARG